MKKIIFLILLIPFIYSCQTNLEYEIKGYTQKIIVEGSISTDEFPVVYLSLNVPVSEQIDSATMLDHVIRAARVTVSDGEKTEILTSLWDKTHFPPYVYKGTELKGVEGKTYTLTVDYSGYTLHATTTIPYGTAISELNTKQSSLGDSIKNLTMTFNIPAETKNGYRVFTKKSKDGFYTVTPLVFNADFKLIGKQSFYISPVPSLSDPSYDEASYFLKGDTIKIRFCTIDSVASSFYNAISIYSSISGIGNAFFMGEKNKLTTNISEPGFGVWCGNGVRNYSYIIP